MTTIVFDFSFVLKALFIPWLWQETTMNLDMYSVCEIPTIYLLRFFISKSEWKKKQDTFKNWQMVKIHFFRSIFMKFGEIWVIIFTKFHDNRTRNLDFLLMAKFSEYLFFYVLI